MSKVHAEWIDETQFAYLCYDCDKYHRHGNVRDFITNRDEPRVSHCEQPKEVEIAITKLTKRLLNKENMKIYEQSLK